jgi:3-mercaptopyruvate sulfurtransferase SseA
MKLVWTGTEQKPVATLIKPKPPLKVAQEKQVSFKELQALIRKRPMEGKYTLMDSRPPTAYMAGHIPYAKSLPYPKLKKKKAAALPKDKDRLLIFYCGGFA